MLFSISRLPATHCNSGKGAGVLAEKGFQQGERHYWGEGMGLILLRGVFGSPKISINYR